MSFNIHFDLFDNVIQSQTSDDSSTKNLYDRILKLLSG